ncbi:MAG: hypothetical protein PUC50_08440 [Bacteroidales bacterium]|nr:hypothetical protein [Bacteroidales bacterium]
MSKLYVFGIGGTGSRVIKALTMLLASGVKCNSTIVPVIIDPDQDAADLTRATEFMKLYIKIHNNSKFKDGKDCFFKTEIVQTVQNFRLPIDNTLNVKFSEFIGLKSLDDSSRALCEALFSQKNLDSDMKVGFKGNPNIGSVVLNQFSESQIFKNIANSFQQGDRIFIISSIFGGTGASGFPLLLKNLRTNDQIPNHSLINNAKIGAITVLPYFSLKSDSESEIDSSTFISKTKSALGYYEKNISSNNSLDTLYYIGDNLTNALDNCEGGKEQKNPAHLIELVSALAILDFEKADLPEYTQTVHKEFGVINDNSTLTFSDLATETNKTIQQRLVQMFLFVKYLKTTLQSQISYQPWAKKRKIAKSFLDSEFYKNVTMFSDSYAEWLKEMAQTQRTFLPFVEGRQTDVFEMVNGILPNSSRFKSYALLDDLLNAENDDKNTKSDEQFLELFENATKNAVSKKFNF